MEGKLKIFLTHSPGSVITEEASYLKRCDWCMITQEPKEADIILIPKNVLQKHNNIDRSYAIIIHQLIDALDRGVPVKDKVWFDKVVSNEKLDYVNDYTAKKPFAGLFFCGQWAYDLESRIRNTIINLGGGIAGKLSPFLPVITFQPSDAKEFSDETIKLFSINDATLFSSSFVKLKEKNPETKFKDHKERIPWLEALYTKRPQEILKTWIHIGPYVWDRLSTIFQTMPAIEITQDKSPSQTALNICMYATKEEITSHNRTVCCIESWFYDWREHENCPPSHIPFFVHPEHPEAFLGLPFILLGEHKNPEMEQLAFGMKLLKGVPVTENNVPRNTVFIYYPGQYTDYHRLRRMLNTARRYSNGEQFEVYACEVVRALLANSRDHEETIKDNCRLNITRLFEYKSEFNADHPFDKERFGVTEDCLFFRIRELKRPLQEGSTVATLQTKRPKLEHQENFELMHALLYYTAFEFSHLGSSNLHPIAYFDRQPYLYKAEEKNCTEKNYNELKANVLKVFNLNYIKTTTKELTDKDMLKFTYVSEKVTDLASITFNKSTQTLQLEVHKSFATQFTSFSLKNVTYIIICPTNQCKCKKRILPKYITTKECNDYSEVVTDPVVPQRQQFQLLYKCMQDQGKCELELRCDGTTMHVAELKTIQISTQMLISIFFKAYSNKTM